MLVGTKGPWSPSPAGARGEIPGGFLGLSPSLPGSFGTGMTLCRGGPQEGMERCNANHPPAKPRFVSGTGRAGGAGGWLSLPEASERTCLPVSVPACSSRSTRLLQGETREGEEGDAELRGNDAANPRDRGVGVGGMFCLVPGSVPRRGRGETGEGPEAGRDGRSLPGGL